MTSREIVTPELQLRTLYTIRPATRGHDDSSRRIIATAEVSIRPAPFFVLIRGESSVVWAVRHDLPDQIALQLDRLAAAEPPLTDFEAPPLHADAYRSLLGSGVIHSGPAFRFPDRIESPAGVSSEIAVIDNLELLERHFRGWKPAEIPLSSPIVAVMYAGYAVSVCFCATINSAPAIEAGVETAPDFRGRGYAARVTAAWAAAIRASGRIPLYSTGSSNDASRAVARKLGLIQYASDWSVAPGP